MQLHQYFLLLKVCFDVSFVAGTSEDPVSDEESAEASAGEEGRHGWWWRGEDKQRAAADYRASEVQLVTTTGHPRVTVRQGRLLELKYLDCKFSFCQVFWGREERVSSLTIARSSETVPSGTSFSLLLHQGQVRESVLLLESSDDIFAGILKSCD